MTLIQRASLPLLCVAALAAFATSSNAAVLEEIDAHTTRGHTVFVVLTDAAATNLDAAQQVAAAAQQQTPNSGVVLLNRSDPAQRAAVAKYRVAGAPVPLVLVIARNGLAVGAARPGAPNAVARLVGLVPSPAKADYLRILSERRVAMVVFSRRGMPEQSPLFEQISATTKMPKPKPGTVLVDLDDPREQRFVTQWKLDPAKIKRPLMIFVNPKGQIVGRLEGAPAAADLVKTSRNKVKGCGCGDPKCKGHK